MPTSKFIRSINSYFIKKFLSVEERTTSEIGSPKNILIVRQHNQFGDMLASVSLFRAIKETYPEAKLTIFASPQNYRPIENNPYIDRLFLFDKRKLFNIKYLLELKAILKENYDLAIVPATVAISSTSCILVGFTNAKIKIGPKSLDGNFNQLNEIFHHRIDLNWKKHPDAHVSDFILEVVRPFGIHTNNYSSVIPIAATDFKYADDFIKGLDLSSDEKLIGIHLGAAKPKNRWSLNKFLEIIRQIKECYRAKIYFTCGRADLEELRFMEKHYSETKNYWNKTIPQLAAIIERSNLFISNDTGVMHVAGTTKTPLISIFGPTNPYNWAPLGPNKYFLRKSELIGDVSVEDVINLIKYLI
jgi:ADP-heptose:LPS heptosyltransferase